MAASLLAAIAAQSLELEPAADSLKVSEAIDSPSTVENVLRVTVPAHCSSPVWRFVPSSTMVEVPTMRKSAFASALA